MHNSLTFRAALSAPTSIEAEKTLSITILAVSITSVLGAGWMILSFILIPSLRTFRHQLILGLGISDFMIALNFMISTTMNFTGHEIWQPAQLAFCSFNGFMAQLFIIQTDYWVLLIAICTYVILSDNKRASAWMQGHPIVIWCLPWGLSALWAVLGLVIVGYGNIGAWCWFTSDRIRLLVNFIPRWIIVIAIIVLYAQLCWILLKAHRAVSSSEEDDTFIMLSRSQDTQRRRQDPSPNNSSNSRSFRKVHPAPSLKKMSQRMMLYPTVYMMIWIIPTAIRIYQSTAKRPVPLSINILDKVCIAIQGLVDAIIYGKYSSPAQIVCSSLTRQG
ncbi:uncharacterized protein P174DRAFT_362277 [Aspergillus novofumigatus IBT 16806]|uniref:G-protein coupled receptors family 2 profile 2 domain-containing protein n=1 Tax=Aspergillus novofumigatus (strain IBT 16806) TaxID=1392255 RepID=A0A2I1CJS6_ASPN1|nr:uncharacterized protein P174DRAFT_362277 [Aspergillus novofumigatus IBT 16806]PKX97867.1 hypothetical protein P174DRAFT_362277 [Aspergillus novofumigatus IBT 16806]